ncbi:hypothetical protein [Rhizobium tropici]|uniref:Uncharacterized protein n=1 Tax=Rhizobium tropici TaxID=398 RepID=A0A329Y6A1_RHITR|nr:hypothetical protein [Rhizobium tropici]RAX38996.1 hypothetical protein DQ393_23825 [Rhizobium tropici]
MHRFVFPLLLLTVSVSPALCDDAKPAEPAESAADMQSMKDFLQANPDCREFNDSCSYCIVTDGRADCSTPQIACVKKAYQCTARSGK